MDYMLTFVVGLVVGYVVFRRNISDYRFRIVKDGKAAFYVANKVVDEKWADGLAEFSYIDLKEEKP